MFGDKVVVEKVFELLDDSKVQVCILSIVDRGGLYLVENSRGREGYKFTTNCISVRGTEYEHAEKLYNYTLQKLVKEGYKAREEESSDGITRVEIQKYWPLSLKDSSFTAGLLDSDAWSMQLHPEGIPVSVLIEDSIQLFDRKGNKVYCPNKTLEALLNLPGNTHLEAIWGSGLLWVRDVLRFRNMDTKQLPYSKRYGIIRRMFADAVANISIETSEEPSPNNSEEEAALDFDCLYGCVFRLTQLKSRENKASLFKEAPDTGEYGMLFINRHAVYPQGNIPKAVYVERYPKKSSFIVSKFNKGTDGSPGSITLKLCNDINPSGIEDFEEVGTVTVPENTILEPGDIVKVKYLNADADGLSEAEYLYLDEDGDESDCVLSELRY